MKSLLERWIGLALSLLVFALPAGATWSIVIVDRRTGEIGVACATCLTGVGIRGAVPVMHIGKGVAAAQSFVDVTGQNRALIFDALGDGVAPADILEALAIQDGPTGHNTRQYGIVSLLNGDPLTFTGNSTFAWAGGVTGTIGEHIQYAIQGNILVGEICVDAAEDALVNTPGDLGTRLMAAMVAARETGGDSRCNCSPGCGVPPPAPFNSSWTAFIGIGRLGDIDSECGAGGCAEGDYYLKRQTIFVPKAPLPDSVDRLVLRYNTWRNSLVGRPDHYLSTVYSPTDDVPFANGRYRKSYMISLVDVDGTPLSTGGASVTITPAEGSVPFTTDALVDNENGTYTFDFVAGALPGIARMEVVVDDGVRPVLLAPFAEVEVAPAAVLSRAPAGLGAAVGGTVDFVIAEPSRAGSAYLLLGSDTGSEPGITMAGVTLGLNPGPAFFCTLNAANSELLPNTFGVLDARGRAQCSFVSPPDFLGGLVGAQLDFAAVFFGPLGTTSTVSVAVTP